MAAPAQHIPIGKASPAVRAFELNPFRILRLEVNASTTDAANRAESAITLERVGLNLSEPDPLPWLAPAGSYELQQAAQTIEEPLVRLKHQMLWFDFVRDPSAEVLRAAIADFRSEALRRYLAAKAELPHVGEAALAADSAGESVEVALVDLAQSSSRCPACGAAVAGAATGCAACGLSWDVVEESGDDVAPAPNAAKGEKGDDLKHEIEINFWESIRGGDATLKVVYRDDCSACGTTGKDPGRTVACPGCKGAACMRCDGSGRLPVNCADCRGRGWRERAENVTVRIPAGIRNGMSIRLRGKGLAGKHGAAAGDLYVSVKLRPHDFFRREGNDLHIQVPLSPAEVASGTEMDIPTVDRVVRIRIPQGTKSGQILQLREKGVWDLRRQQRGDLYVEAVVVASDQKYNQLRREYNERSRQARAAAGAPISNSRPDEKRVFTRRLEIPVDPSKMAHAINQANLRLLLAAASIDGFTGVDASLPAESRTTAAAKWTSWNGFQKLPNAHLAFSGAASAKDAVDSQDYWRAGLQQWVQILAHPWFEPYIEVCIADLGDDYASADDVETVVESVRTQLVDLSAQQARYLLLDGRYGPAGSMIAAMAESGMEARVLTPATRPLRNVFQSEISELDALLEAPGGSVVEAVDAYLKRLDAIKVRWTQLDAKGVVGLRDLIDQAVEKAFLALRSLEKRETSVDALLVQAGKIASAQSLRERLVSFQAELVEDRERMCQFCKIERPDYEKSVVLTGKKVTGQTRSGNTITTHYALRYKLMFRCARCARFHDYILNVEKVTFGFLVGYIALAILAMVLPSGDFGALLGTGLIMFVFGWIPIYGVLWCVNRVLRFSMTASLTPKEHRRIGDISDTTGAKELAREGFGVTPDFSIDAIAKIKKA